MTYMVASGLEKLLASPPGWMRTARLGLLCNPASVDRRLRHARDLILDRFPGQLQALFSPQHGFFAEKQDNMIESPHFSDPVSGRPVFSLYGETRTPSPEMFERIDLLLVDLQDVGTRVYTFASTLSYCLEVAGTLGKKVVVLDRPNPIGGLEIEGNLLEADCVSFVGRYPIPMRHGLTMGELARLMTGHFGIDVDLQVVALGGWRRAMLFGDTGLPWVLPSPNLPTAASALVYPGQVIWEGTNISEGRGTGLPFELCGAPFIDPAHLIAFLGGPDIPGAILRPAAFEPTSNKWAGQLCRGVQIHVTDAARFRPYATTLGLLQAILAQHRNEFEWKTTAYEYETERLAIDLILGSRQLRMRLERLDALEQLVADWQGQFNFYRNLCEPALLYR